MPQTFLVRMGAEHRRVTNAPCIWYNSGGDGNAATAAEALAAVNGVGGTTLSVENLVDAERDGLHSFEFELDTDAIVLDTGTVDLAGLPTGWTPTSLVLHVRLLTAGQAFQFLMDLGATVIEATSVGASYGDTAHTVASPPTAPALWAGTFGVQATLPTINDFFSIDEFWLTGTYEIRAWWWNSTTGDYVFGEDPGAGYVAVDHPTPVIDSMSPSSGPIAGGTAFTILGDGFLGPDGLPAVEGVIFDGDFPATSVVVVDQHELTGVTPAHWKGGVDVVVTLAFTP